MKKWIWITIIGAIAVGVWSYLGRAKPLEVAVSEVTRGTVEFTVSNTRAGTIKACRRSGLSMPIGGRVEALLVDEGDIVKRGDLLLELWNDDRKALTAQSSAQLAATMHRREQRCVESENAAREARRAEQMFERKLTSDEAREAARTRAQASALACQASKDDEEVARANLALNQALLAETHLKAPFDGVVAEITGEIGEYVTPSPPGVATPPAVDLIDYSCLYVTAPIDEVDAGHLKIGQEARISLDAFRGEHFEGRLDRIAPYVLEIEKQARTVEVDILFSNDADRERLLVGYSADIDVILDRHEEVLRIPSELLLDDETVWLFDPAAGVIRKTPVDIGLRNWNFIEVTGGLNAGDQVVSSLDVEGLEDGARAIIRE